MKVIRLSCFFLAISMFVVGGASADVLFSDDFEDGSIDAAKWDAAAAWQVVDNADGVAVLGSFVLDCLGGEEALTVAEFPEEYDYYANFKAVDAGVVGFLFQAQDTSNLYMHQISVTDSNWTPNHIRWHSKIAGAYAVEALPFVDEVERLFDVWYRVRFEVRGASFAAYIGDAGAGMNDLALVSEWTHADESFTSGKIGIRMSGSEHAMYDNITVVTPGANPDGGTAVDYHGKLAGTWGSLKK